MTDPEQTAHEIPSFDTVVTAYGEILEHNWRYSGLGGALSGILSGLIASQAEELPEAASADVDES